jgi:hypothetical protein
MNMWALWIFGDSTFLDFLSRLRRHRSVDATVHESGLHRSCGGRVGRNRWRAWRLSRVFPDRALGSAVSHLVFSVFLRGSGSLLFGLLVFHAVA